MASRRDGLRPVQCLRPLPQAAWSSATYLLEDGRHQEPEPCQDRTARYAHEEEGKLSDSMSRRILSLANNHLSRAFPRV